MSEEERETLEKARDILCNFEGKARGQDIDALNYGYSSNDMATLSKTINYLDYILDTKWDD